MKSRTILANTAAILLAAPVAIFSAPPVGAAEPAPFALGPSASPGASFAIDTLASLSAGATARSETEIRRRPALSGDLLMLQGEHVVRRLPIFLTAAEAGRATMLEVGAITAVDVLETMSAVDVVLNNNLVGTLRPSSDGAVTMSVRLEPGQVVAGFNELMFVARHEHRIDCSVAATYELWTQIVPELTGIVVSRAPVGAVTRAELPSLLGSTGNPSTLQLVPPSPLDDAAATRLVRLVNAVVLNSWMPRPDVRLAGDGAGEGMVLRLERTPGPSLVPFSDVDGLFLDIGEDGTPRAIVLGGDAARMEAALAALEAASGRQFPVGSERGVTALLSLFGTALADETAYSFASLAFDDFSFAGRHARVDLLAVLPPDFFRADYGDLRLFLDGATASGLVEGSVLQVKVNDVETLTLPLASGRLTEFRQKELRIPLNMLHAGLNTVTIEADLLAEGDEACAPDAAPVTTPRLEIRSTSRLVAPKFARVGVAPNLAATFSHAYPYALESNAPTMVFAVGERTEALASAAAFLARMTANAQRIVPYEVTLRKPTQAEHGVVVGPAASMPDWAQPVLGTLEPLGEPMPAVAIAEQNSFVAETPELDIVRQRFTTQSIVGDEADQQPLLEQARALLAGEAAELGSRALAAAEGATRAIFGGGAELKERMYTPADVVLAQSVASDADGLGAVTSAILPSAPPRTWTLVATPDTATLRRALAGPSDAGLRFVPRGAHYVYGESRDRAVEPGAEATLFATQSPGVFNLRLVAAGWLSHNPKVYVAVVVGIVGLIGVLLLTGLGRGRARHGD